MTMSMKCKANWIPEKSYYLFITNKQTIIVWKVLKLTNQYSVKEQKYFKPTNERECCHEEGSL